MKGYGKNCMIRFESDYLEGAHERILKRMAETNLEQTPGYGEDVHCERARELIAKACGAPDAYVQFLVGGTQTNATVISAALRPWQGALAADTGHINVHETGAVEATGHKVLPLQNCNGKISAAQVQDYCAAHYADASAEHTVQPGLVYISHPTECGTLYTLEELQALRRVCDRYGLFLFLDGARLGYGLEAPGTDVTLPELYRLCDVFYIGGTKVGALFGEAVVIRCEALRQNFRYMIKQQGGMLAKGRLLGIQFETLFEDGLYFDISKKAVALALRIKEAFAKKGVSFFCDSVTNQQFPILTTEMEESLNKEFSFSPWTAQAQGKQAVRFCTSWATEEKNVDCLIRAIERL